MQLQSHTMVMTCPPAHSSNQVDVQPVLDLLDTHEAYNIRYHGVTVPKLGSQYYATEIHFTVQSDIPGELVAQAVETLEGVKLLIHEYSEEVLEEGN